MSPIGTALNWLIPVCCLLLHQDQQRGDHAVCAHGGHSFFVSRQKVLLVGNEPLLNFVFSLHFSVSRNPSNDLPPPINLFSIPHLVTSHN